MTDEASRHIDEAATETAVNPAVAPAPKRPEPRGATSTKRSDKLPLLTFLGRNQRGPGVLAGGAVGVLLLGAIALVVALVAVTIAIGRAPQEAAANPRATVTQTTPSAPTSGNSDLANAAPVCTEISAANAAIIGRCVGGFMYSVRGKQSAGLPVCRASR